MMRAAIRNMAGECREWQRCYASAVRGQQAVAGAAGSAVCYVLRSRSVEMRRNAFVVGGVWRARIGRKAQAQRAMPAVYRFSPAASVDSTRDAAACQRYCSKPALL